MKEDTKRSNSTILWLLIMIVLLLIIAFGITLLTKNNETSVGTNNVEISVTDESETESVPSEAESVVTEPSEESETEHFDGLNIYDSEIYSDTALLMSIDGEELYSKNGEEQMYPASLTKIMTAIIALENINYLDESVVVPGDIFEYIESEGAATAGFSAYESVSYRDLLYGALLSSGAECCLTLADYLGGSEEMFVQMMNEKAAEIGMENTHFTNVIGLHNYEHYSTAEDIAKLLIYALDNDEFRKIFTSQSYYTETDYQPYGVTLSSTMFSELDSEYFVGGAFLGGKTGYTSEAGYCLASLSRVNGKEYILITAGAEGSNYMGSLRIADAVNIYETLAENT
ncbi:MAG: serine hydrolase [Oscillospiraceae bacterium]|nr:serine hydrolase [Oscillospiraceae bacterium]